jgi:hypothetical protein
MSREQIQTCRIWGFHSGGYEEYHLLGCDAVLRCNGRFGGAYRRLAVYSACHLLTCWFLLKIFFDPEDGGDMFLRNVGCISTDYTASHPRRWYSSNPDLLESKASHPIIRLYIVWPTDRAVKQTTNENKNSLNMHDMDNGTSFSRNFETVASTEA